MDITVGDEDCRKCGCWLQCPVSFEFGLCPACRIKAKPTACGSWYKRDIFNMERSIFDAEDYGDIICITDLSDGSTVRRTVTGDTTRVIDNIAESFGHLSGRRVIYRDTSGVWDEIVVTANKFSGFAAIGVRTLEEALKEITRRSSQDLPTLAKLIADAPSHMQVDTDKSGRVVAIRFLNS